MKKYAVRILWTDPDFCDGSITVVVEADSKVGAIIEASSLVAGKLTDAAVSVSAYIYKGDGRE